MFNPLTLISTTISTTREKILFCVALLLIGIVGGWTLHSMWDDWLNSGDVHRQLERAQEAPGKIINFNQAMRKTHVEKEPCYNQSIPADVLKLLH